MLFNSYVFLFVFLPVTVLGYVYCGRAGRRAVLLWLILASLTFYGWWNPAYLLLLVASIAVNFTIAQVLRTRPSRPLLAVGIALNLLAIGYFKYANFFVDGWNELTGYSFEVGSIVLPLAISFFTFQQIAYLVDAHRGLINSHDWLEYTLFVTFFPQLIAGPIVHHAEIIPQYPRALSGSVQARNLAVGSTIFLLGLFKKVVIADTIASYSTPMFDAAAGGVAVSLLEAWGGSLAYTFQIYFDFSGYSDMAIGAARLFGIRLPANFDSPYKARNIIEFWRRWHMTLSRFLRNYLYFPLGGNRHGSFRRYQNLMIVMLLGGLWHGAGWTFVLWGGLHGLFLVVNHAWRALFPNPGDPGTIRASVGDFAARTTTFVSVVVAWTVFRADDWEAARTVLKGMAGLNGFLLPDTFATLQGPLRGLLEASGGTFVRPYDLPFFSGLEELLWLTILLLIVWCMPNSLELIARFRPAVNWSRSDRAGWYREFEWRPTTLWAGVMAVVGMIAVFALAQETEFLYFQF